MQWVAFIAAAVVVLDQLTKWLIVRVVGPDDSLVVIGGFFNLVNWSNTGAAWGMFQHSNLFLAVISVVTVAALYLFRRSFHLTRWGPRIALGLITGGIVGNLIDRVRVGSVIDFLQFYIGRYQWPAFNVADSAICIGVGLYIVLTWRGDSSAPHSSAISSHDGASAH